MPSHFIGIFSLGPSILFYFFRGSTPPLATDEAHVGVSENSVPLNPMVDDHYPY